MAEFADKSSSLLQKFLALDLEKNLLTDSEKDTLQKLIHQTQSVPEKSSRNRLALLITNEDFAKADKKRHGAKKDEENMLMLLEECGYDVQKYTNLTAEEIDSAVKKFSQDPRLFSTDSVFVVIMSHGKMGAIFGKDWPKNKQDEFPIENIYTHLDAKNCPALWNKPKVIIIQACRKEKSAVARDDDDDDDDEEEDAVIVSSFNLPNATAMHVVRRPVWVHKEKNFISLLSCTPYTSSYRDTVDGSFLIQHIVEIFNKFGHEDHIEELFRKVMYHFEEFEKRKPVPSKERCTLTQPFYLFPAVAPSPEAKTCEMSKTLIPCTDAFLKENLKNKEIYPVREKSSRDRLALLINNVKFASQKTRNGADKDEEETLMLLKALGYDVEKYRDLTAEEIDSAVKKFSQDPRLFSTDSVFVVIMSHGEMGVIYGTDGKEYPVEKIYPHLNKDNCPALWNKPKVIIIQSCRGGEPGGVLLDGDDSDASEDGDEDNDTDGEKTIEKDFISLHSSTPHTPSYRHVRDGSFLIQYIVGIFNTFAHEDHIEELFRKVMNRFEENKLEKIKQMATKDRCTLTKPFYLFPGY